MCLFFSSEHFSTSVIGVKTDKRIHLIYKFPLPQNHVDVSIIPHNVKSRNRNKFKSGCSMVIVVQNERGS